MSLQNLDSSPVIVDFKSYEGYVGVDIGGQTIKVGSFIDGKLEAIDIETPQEYSEARTSIIAAARKLIGSTPKGIGIGSPGPMDWKTGFLKWTPNIPWKEIAYLELGDALNCKAFVDNDANVAGLAESVLGGGTGYHIVTGFTLGTGIGYFMVEDGLVYHGRIDVEGGHMLLNPKGPACGCGAKGCLEAYTSASNIEERTGKRPDEIDDPEFWDEIGKYLAWGITNVNMIVCPNIFILCGGMIQRGEMLFSPLRKYLTEFNKLIPAPMVAPAQLGTRAGLYGAIVLAKNGHRQ